MKNTNDATKSVRNNFNNNNDSHKDHHSVVLKVSVNIGNSDIVNGILVECGAATHIVHDSSKFTECNLPLFLVGYCDADWGSSEDKVLSDHHSEAP